MLDLTQKIKVLADKPKKLVAITNPTDTLDSIKVRDILYVPNYQRESINGTVSRFRNRSSKRFTCNRINDEFFIITRIR